MQNKKSTTLSTGVTLYDINKQMSKELPPLPQLAIAAKQKELEDWFNLQLDGYAMLLSNERHDYTIFHLYEEANPNPSAIAASELIGCLTDRGDIISIDKLEDDNYEIWIRIDDEDFMYMLFPCDDFVIEC